MGGAGPVFSENRDRRLWKSLCDMENTYCQRNAQRYTNKLERIVQDIDRRGNEENPWILCKILDLIDILPMEKKRQAIMDMVQRCCLSDSRPRLKASGLLMELQDYDTAAFIMDGMKFRNDIPEWEYQRAMLCLAVGDNDSAYRHLAECYNSDNNYNSVCTELENLSPGLGWEYRGRIEHLHNGAEVHIPASLSKTPLEELSLLYRDWYAGDRSVLQTIRLSSEYEKGDRDYVIASARFSSEIGDHRTSVSEYSKVSGLGFSLSLELVREMIASDMLSEASDLCDSLSKICEGDRRLNELQIDLFIKTGDKNALSLHIDRFLSYDYADMDAHMMAASVLMDANMLADSTSILMRLEDSYSDDPRVNLLSSRNSLTSGNLPSALAEVNKAIRKNPNDIACRIQRATILYRMGSVNKAMDDLRFVLHHDPDNHDALISRRDIYVNGRDYDHALSECQRIRELEPDNAGNIEIMASVLDRMGKRDDALRTYREAIGMSRDRNLFNKVIVQLVEDERYEDAILVIGEYDDIYGDSRDTWVLKGNAEYRLGRYADACTSYDRALDMDRSDHMVWHCKGMAAEMLGDLETADDAYSKAVLIELDNSQYWISKSIISEKLGDIKGSISALDHIISTHPDNTYALVKKAHILTMNGKEREAVTLLEMASMSNPRNVEVKCALRDIHLRLGNNERALAFAKDAVRLKKDDLTRISLARIYASIGRYDDAIKYVEGSKSLVSLKFIREIHHLKEDDKSEQQTCRRILKDHPDDVDTIIALADLYSRTGKDSEASRLYEKARELRPDDDVIQEKHENASTIADENERLESLKKEAFENPSDPEPLMELADSMIRNQQYQEAERYLDMAIEADSQSPAPYLKKASIKMDLGLYQDALDILNDAKDSAFIQDPGIWVGIGDAHRALGSPSDALEAYSSALKLDGNIKGMHKRVGNIQYEMGMLDSARANLEVAYSEDKDTDTLMKLATIGYGQGNIKVSERYLDELLSVEPYNGPAIVMKCRILQIHNDDKSIEDILEKVKSRGDVDQDYINDIEYILSTTRVQPQDDPTDMKAQALRLLKASDTLNGRLDDPAVIETSGLSEEQMGSVLAYLSDITPVKSSELDRESLLRMEELSYNAIVNGNVDVDSISIIPLQVAALRSGAKDTDEAKELVAYVYDIMTSDSLPKMKGLEELVSELRGEDVSTKEIMERYAVGVCCARMVKMMLSQ